MTAPDRFKPTRAGIIGLWEYEEQTFNFGDGRIALRGRNTSGKSKALEVLVPFVFDGDIRPHKLDPFGKNDKTMAWNLVGCDETRSTRVGYAWLEFERVDADGQTQRVTVGIGLKGTSNTNDVKRWYWTLEGGRVGEDLPLIKTTPQGRYALPRDEFKQALETARGGTLFTTQEAYHARINELMFGYSTATYQLMLDLIRELRAPKLSDGLKPRKVTELLTRTLPPVDFDLMRKLGESLEQLAHMQAQVTRLRSAQTRIRAFITGNYRDYARATVSSRADALRSAITRYDDTSSERRTAEQNLTDAQDHLRTVVGQQRKLEGEIQRAAGEHATLIASKSWTQIQDYEQAAEDHRKAKQRADEAREGIALATGEQAERAAELEGEQEAVAGDLRGLEVVERDMQGHADAAGIAARHETLRDELFGGQVDPHTAINVLRAEADAREQRVRDADRHLDTIATLTSRAEAKEQTVTRLAGELDKARARRSELASHVTAAEEALAGAVEAWAEDLLELPVDSELMGRIVESALAPISRSDRLWETVAGVHRESLIEQRAGVRTQRAAIAEQIAVLEAEREQIAQQRDPVPPQRGQLRADRGSELTPLWQLVDFAPSLDPDQRARVEAALEESGVLDALVGAEDRENDSRLRPAPVTGSTLADVLVAAPGDTGADPQLITQILRSVPYENDAYELSVSAGAFRIGPLHGRYDKPAAQFIGAAAREAHRAALLADIDARIGGLGAQDAVLLAAEDELDARILEVAAEIARFPSRDELDAARVNFHSAERAERQADTNLQAEQGELAAINQQLDQARDTLAAYCTEHSLPTDRDALRRVSEAARDYRATLGGAHRALSELDRKRRAVQTAERRLRAAEERVEQVAALERRDSGEERRMAGHLAAIEKTLDADVDELKAQVDELAKRLRTLREQEQAESAEFTSASVQVQAKITERDRAAEQFELAEQRRQERLDAFKRLELADMFRLALADAAPADHEQAAEWTYTQTVDVFRALPSDRLRLRPGSTVETLTNLVQRDCSELDRVLAEYEMQVVTSLVDGMTIAKITEGGVERTAAALADALSHELEVREQALSAEQQRIFGDTLIEEISEHLRQRITGVRENVKAINDKLAKCPTGSGRTVSLSWDPGELDGIDMTPIVSLIAGRSIAALRADQRATLVEFFRRRIDEARERHVADANGEHATAAYLMDAFDYRTWFAFDLYQRDLQGRRERLTSSRHGTGSGGEQAVLMHMPLFAAAAALYDSARLGIAPRLIALDEALSGIDEQTRPHVLRVTVELDLDVFLTAYEIKPYYPTIPRISVYVLHRVNGEWGVFAEWFEWDGVDLHQRDLDDPQLQVV